MIYAALVIFLPLIWISIVLTKISTDIETIALKGKMTPEKAKRIKPFLELLKQCEGEQYEKVLADIRRIEAE